MEKLFIYHPSKHKSSFSSDFSDLISYVVFSCDKILLVGDFDIHVDDPIDILASQFLNICASFNTKQHLSHPTHEQGHTLDSVFTMGLSANSLTLNDFYL